MSGGVLLVICIFSLFIVCPSRPTPEETVSDFGGLRLVVAEWDWTHNRSRGSWQRAEAHLRSHGFVVDVRGWMPAFDEAGDAVLCNASGKKRGNTGMIFSASRKVIIIVIIVITILSIMIIINEYIYIYMCIYMYIYIYIYMYMYVYTY